MNVTLRQLRAFANVAELGSFVDAARSMHVSASALSLIVGELEAALGFRVFERTTRRVTLSVAGEEYLPYALRVLANFDSAHRCAIELREHKTSVVRIASSQTIAWMLMPPAFSTFRVLRPDVRLELLDLPVDQVLPALEAGSADLAIALRSPTEMEVQSTALFSSRMHLACRGDHVWAARKRLRWADLSQEPLIFTGNESPQRINAALPQGPLLQAAWQVEHSGTALALVASGFGSAVCAGYVHAMSEMHRLHMIPLAEPTVVREIALYSSRKRPSKPAVEAFREFLVAHFARTGQRFIEQGSRN